MLQIKLQKKKWQDYNKKNQKRKMKKKDQECYKNKIN